ncbi:MAG: gamma-glutamyltransferase [Hyphomicrobiaceae bacterium]|nr:gamma-glutamyltransferase [Hyphomicrobiaceae bacterium]
MSGITSHRPVISARHAISAGHYLAAHAGFAVLEADGNAIDAGVAGGLALGVLQSDLVSVAGVAPIILILYHAESREVFTISGLGVWPKLVTPDYFMKRHGGKILRGRLRTVVPAARDETLLRWGTMSFGEVAAAAVRFDYEEWPSNRAIFQPHGRPPEVGELFVQSDLGSSLQYMIDQEAAALSQGRQAGLLAARSAFYRGDLGRTIVAYHEANGGLWRMDDLAEFRSGIEPSVAVRFGELSVHTRGPWCQGPVLAQMLRLVEATGIHREPHNSFRYVHGLTEITKTAFADRHAYYGDPRFVEVPLERLLSEAYAAERARCVRPNQTWPGIPPAGLAKASMVHAYGPVTAAPQPQLDTSYVCVVDRHGNAFSATPSDASSSTPVIPGTGLCPSSRGSQSWADPALPACVAPGKRPRLTPSPAFALGRDGRAIPFGTPGGDVQAQAMLQVLLNRIVYGMDPQAAVEALRFATYSFPDSFEPHSIQPGRLLLEARLPPALGEKPASVGHDVAWWPDWTWKAGAVCMIDSDPRAGVHHAGADPRRSTYALGS